jgi:hypothetical protein
MIVGKEYQIRRNYGYSPVALTEEEYPVENCKTKEEAENKIKILEKEIPARYWIREIFVESSPYGDWRDVYG